MTTVGQSANVQLLRVLSRLRHFVTPMPNMCRLEAKLADLEGGGKNKKTIENPMNALE